VVKKTEVKTISFFQKAFVFDKSLPFEHDALASGTTKWTLASGHAKRFPMLQLQGKIQRFSFV
jgi:hypothetical protein